MNEIIGIDIFLKIYLKNISIEDKPLLLAIKIWLDVNIETIWFLVKIVYAAKETKVTVNIGRNNDFIVINHPSYNGSLKSGNINPSELTANKIIIGAKTNDGNPTKNITNIFMSASTHVPLLYPAKTPNPIPNIDENIKAGTVIKSVNLNGRKKNVGIFVDSVPIGTYILPNVPLKTSWIYLPNLINIGSFNPAASANLSAFSGSLENGFLENDAIKK